ncbi:phytase [Cellvibrio fibrivorans]|uniref:3-phytase n=1 Tax=Cellvibrio fibrivorans TaxID=126350 RepID=A0ABU1USB5_9GAMM|nr:phytase [Cellvibrio fibrivorans]MDR7088042.1 3-phytase [Cellvibrio fibrivorans]
MISLRKSLLACLFTGLCSSVIADASLPPSLKDGLIAPLPTLLQHQSTFLALGDDIHWRDASGKSLAQLKLPAELLDWRYPVQLQTGKIISSELVAATVFLPEQQPGLVALDPESGKLRELLRLPTPEFKIENLCLSRVNGHLSLYLLDERGTAEHWLVVDAKGTANAKLLRRLPIAPNCKSCAVDDEQDLLFVAEEGIGIWAQGASEESAPGRVAVDLQKPFGSLSGSVESLAIIPQGLVAAVAEEKQLALYSTNKSKFKQQQLVDLPNTDEPEVVKAVVGVADKNSLALVVGDEKTGNHFLFLPWDSVPQKKSPHTIVSITPDVQTQVMARFGDAADDPAIWVNKKRSQKSLVIGTNKQQGLFVYDMQGREVQHFNTGKLNNVDVRYGVQFGKKVVDIAVATNRDDNSLAIYTIDPKNGKLRFSGSVATDLEEIYGFCLYQNGSGVTYAIPNGKSGEFQQIQLSAVIDQKDRNSHVWQGKKVRSFFVKSQPEGCVADDKNQRLFVGEEDEAVWTIGAEPNAGTQVELVLRAGDVLVADVEGMGIYQGKNKNYLVVSSQGNNSYVILDATAPYKTRGVIRVDLDAGRGIDGVSETDGLEVTHANLGGAFGEGMLVVQDGHKVMPEAPQNFKYVSWEKIRTVLALE